MIVFLQMVLRIRFPLENEAATSRNHALRELLFFSYVIGLKLIGDGWYPVVPVGVEVGAVVVLWDCPRLLLTTKARPSMGYWDLSRPSIHYQN